MRRGFLGARRSVWFAAAHALDSQLAHQTLHGATGHRDTFAFELEPDLASAVDPEVRLVDASGLASEPGRSGALPCTSDVLHATPPVESFIGGHLPNTRRSFIRRLTGEIGTPPTRAAELKTRVGV
jgi:hypothetical protein